MKAELIVAIVGIVGVLLGASAQYMFSRYTESAKHLQELRTQSYVDFIKSTADIAIAQEKNDAEKEFEATILMADSKARIAIYGSPTVAAAVADFFRKHGALASPEAFKSFIGIVAEMRADSLGGKNVIPNIDIGQLLLSEDVY